LGVIAFHLAGDPNAKLIERALQVRYETGTQTHQIHARQHDQIGRTRPFPAGHGQPGLQRVLDVRQNLLGQRGPGLAVGQLTAGQHLVRQGLGDLPGLAGLLQAELRQPHCFFQGLGPGLAVIGMILQEGFEPLPAWGEAIPPEMAEDGVTAGVARPRGLQFTLGREQYPGGGAGQGFSFQQGLSH